MNNHIDTSFCEGRGVSLRNVIYNVQEFVELAPRYPFMHPPWKSENLATRSFIAKVPRGEDADFCPPHTLFLNLGGCKRDDFTIF
jgi:hypothetical protein